MSKSPDLKKGMDISMAETFSDNSAYNSSHLLNDSGRVITHSFLLSNLHCPSCVSHIQETLSRLHPISVSPSLVSSWVTVEHTASLSVSDIREALEDAGFDVCDVTPDDESGKKPSPFGTHGEIGYLDRFIDRFELKKNAGSNIKAGPSQKHLQNCEACRLGADAKHDSSSTKFGMLGTAACLSPAIPNELKSKSELQIVVDPDQEEHIWRASLAIGGMTCASCVNAITIELQKKTWIKNVAVNLISNSATVDFVEEQHKVDVVEAIEDIGYDATIDTVFDLNAVAKTAAPSKDTNRTVEVLIDGMYCDHCPPRILSSLKIFGDRIKVEKSLSVADPILSISYTPQVPVFTIRNILQAISDSSTEDDEPFKVSIYHPPTLEERSRQIHQRERLRILIRVIVTFVIAIPTLIIGIVFMSLVPASNSGRQFLMAPLRAGVSRAQWALFIMATPVYFLCADVFHVRALKEIRAMWRPGSTTPMLQRFYRFGSMNMLMSLGTSIAYISSVAQLIAAGVHSSLVPDNNAFYFDSVVFLTLFLLIGRLIEAYSKSKTGDAVQMLGKLRPVEALLVESKDGEHLSSVSVDLLEYGDIVKVLHGGSPPCDGTILSGETKFDEASLTGESRLVKKSVGDEVFSGTINKDSPISIKITGVAGSSMLDQIVKAVREGQTRRAPMERIADTLTSYFVPFVTLIAIVTWIVWLALGYSGTLPEDYLGDDSGGWVAWSLQFAIAVFVVACPCGLALAAPTALFVGGGLAAQHGILVKGGGEAFEKASRLDCIVFDKTGTLTVGEQPAVTDISGLPMELGKYNVAESEKAVLAMVRAIEDNSSHTVAQALQSYCKDKLVEAVRVELKSVEELPGRGMGGLFGVPKSEDVHIIIGNEALMAESHVSITHNAQATLEDWKSNGKSVVLVAISVDRASEMESPTLADRTWQLATMFAVSDPIRPESPQIIEQLKKRGLQVWMLSGDNHVTANAIGAQVGIPAENIIAGVLPSEKADKIQYLQKSLKSRRGLMSGVEHSQKRALIAMVGDGINDSPALTTADVGVAIGSGSDIAISSAEFVLVSSNLNTLITLLDLSGIVFKRIEFNFGWALVYNLIALPVAAGVLYPIVSNGSHIRLDPVWASLAMAASSISVVCSSLALRSKIPWVGFKARDRS
ncbi:Copper-transporting ATPase HMA5 [Hyphodiscus hymeniophilus]|uniref:Copper-transporting ATPase HMA5 n=1 Tax=Hyphodiscus hymeniophilus TaxID=353542 RepID=A0A9P6SL29_9HELO|nr:Copper-transporting ATPase HMA5 [Hyphodiscus hymeniophilus]